MIAQCGVRPLTKNQSRNHNPTRQRGIYGDTCKTLPLIPSLTFRVVIFRLSKTEPYFGTVPESTDT